MFLFLPSKFCARGNNVGWPSRTSRFNNREDGHPSLLQLCEKAQPSVIPGIRPDRQDEDEDEAMRRSNVNGIVIIALSREAGRGIAGWRIRRMTKWIVTAMGRFDR
jgi:hypothetical protein